MNKFFGDGMGDMLKQAQQLQSKMKKIQEEISEKTLDVSSGGGMVSVKITGKQQILSMSIDPEVLKQNDIEMIQDLVLSAVNEAIRQSQELMQSELSKLTGGLNIPGLF